MFLALKEIKHEKLRYSLIIAMIVLISYLIFILTSLALGLARENTNAIESWNIQRIALSQDANVSLSQSLLTKQQVPAKLSGHEAYIGQVPVVAKASGEPKTSAQFIGLQSQQFIAKNMQLAAGHKPTTNQEVVVDTSFKNAGYHLGQKIRLSSTSQQFKIVGFINNAKINIAPIVYGTLTAWRSLKNVGPNLVASAIVSQTSHFSQKNDDLKYYSTKQFINKLPGYSAQNSTFAFMIGFLMIISLIVIAVFLYILTVQKLQNYAVLRAQGIPAKTLVGATISQAMILVISGLIIGTALTALTALAMPANVPMTFDLPILGAVALGLVVTGIIGALFPTRMILRVDPVSVIGG
ncbi:ABC transporter permease [Loigolactobacillus jiayinensis]|uniref:Putative hemin transport system permease protein HrtB n=1 Tax=Loigolactobacillus jiayinensis TaxID=2486016 RepID=A0ABW1RE05_9LACO|nr:ABC transporter permease [Loigolactobacillus jiayinensis]